LGAPRRRTLPQRRRWEGTESAPRSQFVPQVLQRFCQDMAVERSTPTETFLNNPAFESSNRRTKEYLNYADWNNRFASENGARAHPKTEDNMHVISYALFKVQQRLRGFTVPDLPHFDSDQSTQWFLSKLAGATRYLEFGTGGSTYQAAKLGIDFVAVDSDAEFLDAVRQKINSDGYRRDNQVLRHADIGKTGAWGRPYGRVDDARLAAFRAYSDPPPQSSAAQLPDLVLVDGRFRIACALKSLNMLWDAKGWTIVVDDYVGRPRYHVIAEYAEVSQVGRMAVITAAKPISRNELIEAIRRWETDSE
jgi:hypothetical protein